MSSLQQYEEELQSLLPRLVDRDGHWFDVLALLQKTPKVDMKTPSQKAFEAFAFSEGGE